MLTTKKTKALIVIANSLRALAVEANRRNQIEAERLKLEAARAELEKLNYEAMQAARGEAKDPMELVNEMMRKMVPQPAGAAPNGE